MVTCKDCIHYDVCDIWRREEGMDAKFYAETEDGKCEHFADKSRFVELPCKIGDKVYLISSSRGKKVISPREVEGVGYFGNQEWLITTTEDWEGWWLGKTVFLAREEAEAELNRRNKQ